MLPKDDGPVLYSVVLRPYRSAGKTTLRWVVGGTALVWATVGLLFAGFGAWPVMPFLGLEVFILFAAFALNNTSGKTEEAINLTATALTVRRVDHWGKQTVSRLPLNWLQVNLEHPATPHCRLELRWHGHSIFVGGFLRPAEKLDLAHALRRQLDRDEITGN